MSESFSVIIGNYNCARFLPASIESVLAQETTPLEILVVDDGSTDGSRASVEPYLGKVEWLGLSHAGQAAAMNAALARCRGDWVAFLESDDLWLPEKLRTVRDLARKDPGLSAVQHSMSQVDAELKPLPTRLPPESRRQTLQDFLAGHALLTGLSALAVRREVVAKLLPLPADLITCVDEYLQPRLLLAGPVLHLAPPLGLRRVHGQNFYAGIRRDPERLRSYLSLRTTLDAHLAAFLKEHRLALEPACERKRRAQHLEYDLLWHRSQGAFSAALRDWRDIIALLGPRPYSLFKAATLAAALLWPPLYFGLFRFYEDQRWLSRLRERLLP